MKHARRGVQMPFCEAYDGVKRRQTRTISESIQNVLGKKSSDVSSLDESFHLRCVANAMDVFDSANMDGCYHDDDDADDDIILPATTVIPMRPLVLIGNANTTKVLQDIDTGLWLGDGVKASVDLQLDYRAKENCLNLTVIAGKIQKKHGKFPDTFITVNLERSGERVHRTRVVKRCAEPQFDELFAIEHVNKAWLHMLVMKIQLCQKNLFRDVVIGGSFIWLDDINLLSNERMAATLVLE